MSKQEYNFKVGDKVITADGRVGKIDHICTCNNCKRRCFYEPEVVFENGDHAYIMYYDKESNFIDYYQIGEYVFGNIDKNGVNERLNKARDEYLALCEQLKVVSALEKETADRARKYGVSQITIDFMKDELGHNMFTEPEKIIKVFEMILDGKSFDESVKAVFGETNEFHRHGFDYIVSRANSWYEYKQKEKDNE